MPPQSVESSINEDLYYSPQIKIDEETLKERVNLFISLLEERYKNVRGESKLFIEELLSFYKEKLSKITPAYYNLIARKTRFYIFTRGEDAQKMLDAVVFSSFLATSVLFPKDDPLNYIRDLNSIKVKEGSGISFYSRNKKEIVLNVKRINEIISIPVFNTHFHEFVHYLGSSYDNVFEEILTLMSNFLTPPLTKSDLDGSELSVKLYANSMRSIPLLKEMGFDTKRFEKIEYYGTSLFVHLIFLNEIKKSGKGNRIENIASFLSNPSFHSLSLKANFSEIVSFAKRFIRDPELDEFRLVRDVKKYFGKVFVNVERENSYLNLSPGEKIIAIRNELKKREDKGKEGKGIYLLILNQIESYLSISNFLLSHNYITEEQKKELDKAFYLDLRGLIRLDVDKIGDEKKLWKNTISLMEKWIKDLINSTFLREGEIALMELGGEKRDGFTFS